MPGGCSRAAASSFSSSRVRQLFEPELMGTVATLYGVGAAGTALLQARQVLSRRSSCEVSARFFATYAGGYAVWLLYGLSIGSLPLIVVDAAGLLCGLITLAITLRLRGSLLRPSSWGKCPQSPPDALENASHVPAAASG